MFAVAFGILLALAIIILAPALFILASAILATYWRQMLAFLLFCTALAGCALLALI
jgi:hypothetical protein